MFDIVYVVLAGVVCFALGIMVTVVALLDKNDELRPWVRYLKGEITKNKLRYLKGCYSTGHKGKGGLQ